MTQPTGAFDLATVEHDLDQSLERLRTPALYDLPPADRARIADSSEEQALQPLRRKIEVEWQRRLVIERGENSLANLLTPVERRDREQYIVATALRQLLPLGRKVVEADALLARLRDQPPPARPGGVEAIDSGLRALAASDLSRALYDWAAAGEPDQVARLVQERREQQGQDLLRQATALFARLPDLASEKERSDLRTAIRREYIEPVRRLGTEQQREKAQQVSSAVDAALNLGRPSSLEPTTPVPAAPQPPAASTRRKEPQPRQEQPGSRRRLLIWALVGALLAAAVFALLPGGDDGTDPPTANGSAPPSAAASVGAGLASAAASSAPAASAAASSAPIVAGSPASTPTLDVAPPSTPTPTPGVVTTAIDPAALFAGRLPAEMTVRGTGLDLVREAQLIPDRGGPIPLEVELRSPEELTLRLTALPEPLNGQVSTVLYLNGNPQETLPIMVRDFLESKTVQGVSARYDYTGRIRSDALGPYTTIHGTPDANTPPVAPLRNGEQVEILRDETAGWYEVRIRVSNDPAQVSKTGWVERWLIDDQDVPLPSIVQPTATAEPAPRLTALPTARPTARPTPRPTPRPTDRPRPPAPSRRAFVAEVVRSYPGSGRSEDRQSCIEGRVRDRSGGGIGGAVVSVNNGAANLDRQTNGAGEFQFCGLGDSTWSVVLRYVPGAPGLAREVAGTVYVNGGSQQSAVVNFREQ